MAGSSKKPVKKKTAKRPGVHKKLPPDTRREIGRFWLIYPQKLITTPVIWQLGQKFKLVTNIRQASVNEEIGLLSIEMEGTRDEIKKGLKWLERRGVKVEPVEINVIES